MRWSDDPQDIINNAFVYACMHHHIDAARMLLQKGAQIDAIPPGFDYSGAGLHYAALNGPPPNRVHRTLVAAAVPFVQVALGRLRYKASTFNLHVRLLRATNGRVNSLRFWKRQLSGNPEWSRQSLSKSSICRSGFTSIGGTAPNRGIV